MKKIHYLTNEERIIAPKILELLKSSDYESSLLGLNLFIEVFGKYYMTRALEEIRIKDLYSKDSVNWNIFNGTFALKYIIKRNFVYEDPDINIINN